MQPHRSRSWLNANPQDPEVFRQQVTAVCDLYEQAGHLAEQGIHLVSTDEKTGIQALERLYPDIPMGPGRVQSREQLLQDVWEYDNLIDTRTVDTHMRRLREKLGPAARYLDTVRGVGYRFLEE